MIFTLQKVNEHSASIWSKEKSITTAITDNTNCDIFASKKNCVKTKNAFFINFNNFTIEQEMSEILNNCRNANDNLMNWWCERRMNVFMCAE